MTRESKPRAGAREVYGPLPASWMIQWKGSAGSTHVNTLERVRSTIAYYAREGRDLATCIVTRTESCPASGCNGDGTRSVKRRGHMFATDVPCVGCRGSHDTLEDVAELAPIDIGETPLNDVLARLGYTTQPAEFGAKVILRNGVPVSAGTAGAVWLWLRESGQIL